MQKEKATMRLNDSVIGGLRAKDSAYYVFRDDGTRGTGRLGIKIFPSGRKSFVYRFQADGKRKFKTLGDWPHFTLEKATQRYAELAGMPLQSRSDAMGKKMRAGTLRELFAAFIAFKSRSGHRSTISQYGALFEQLIKLKLFTGDEIANEITSVQITRCIQHWTKQDFMSRAKEVRKKLHALFEYGIVADNDPLSDVACNGVQFQIAHNPVRNVQNFEAGTPGDRYLDFKELRYLLTLFDNEKNVLPPDVQSLVELGFYTCGQRPFELCHLQKSRYIPEQNKIVLAKEFSKTGIETAIFISNKAKEILNDQASRYPDSDFFFPNVNYEEQLKKYKKELKANPITKMEKPTIGLNSHAWKKHMNEFAKIHFDQPFSMRDIRRTFKTLAGMLHFTENERDIVNQHVNKTISKKHYDKYDYFIEKRETTLKWEKALSLLLEDDGMEIINKIMENDIVL